MPGTLIVKIRLSTMIGTTPAVLSFSRRSATNSTANRPKIAVDAPADSAPAPSGADGGTGRRLGTPALGHALGALVPDRRLVHAVRADRPFAAGAPDVRLPAGMPVADRYPDRGDVRHG